MAFILNNRRRALMQSRGLKPTLSHHQLNRLEETLTCKPEHERDLRKLFDQARAAIRMQYELIAKDEEMEEREAELTRASQFAIILTKAISPKASQSRRFNRKLKRQ